MVEEQCRNCQHKDFDQIKIEYYCRLTGRIIENTDDACKKWMDRRRNDGRR